jgi:DNA polymerase-3 subunit epsilon
MSATTRKIVLDTETTGLEPANGHRIIEIGCVEMANRRLTGNTYHVYLQPDREIDAGAMEVHGITNEFLADKPRFADVAEDFVAFIRGAELIIHNAPFDVGFINTELTRIGSPHGKVADFCSVVDTLVLARQLHPGQRNNLDALCKRYGVNNEHRELHGALLDSEILADVYLAMTGGQTSLSLGVDGDNKLHQPGDIRRLAASRPPLSVVAASPEELALHDALLAIIEKKSGGNCLWSEVKH